MEQYRGENITLFCAEELLETVKDLLPTVLNDANLVKAFIGRWKILRYRAEELYGQIENLSKSPVFELENRICIDLLASIVGTLRECRSEAKKCIDLSYFGKLQTQSNLDMLAGKLNQHVHDCKLMLSNSLMRENGRRSNLGVSREVLRWTIKDLIARLQIGSLQSKQKALNSLTDLMEEEENHKNLQIIAAQGGIPPLVHMLDSSIPAIREKAAAAVCALILSGNWEHQIVLEGCLAPLVRLLESGSSIAKEKSAAAIQILTYTPENSKSVAAQGGISSLIEICRSGTPRAQESAAGCLRNLSSIAEIRHSIVQEMGIPVLIKLIKSGSAAAQENAASALQNLSTNDERTRLVIAKMGGIEPLLRFLDSANGFKAKEIALGVLKNLAMSSSNAKMLQSSGFVQKIAGFLRSGPSSSKQIAAATISQIATCSEIRKQLGDAGCMPHLIKMLESKPNQGQECAAAALASLLLVESNRKNLMAEPGGVNSIAKLLDTNNQSTPKQFSTISALYALIPSSKLRKTLLRHSPGKLPDMEVPSGAKKLLDRIEGGKLRRFFRRS